MENEQQLEQEALAKIDEQKIREEIVADTGLDEVDNAEQIEKLVAREVKTRTFAAKAIGTKVALRTEFDEYKKKTAAAPEPAKQPQFNEEELLSKAEARAVAKMEEREFDNLNLPDDLKAEAKTIAKNTNRTAKQVLEDPYMKFKLQQAVQEGKLDEAAISPSHKSAAATTRSKPPIDISTPEGVAKLATPEGQKAMADYRKTLEKQS